MPLKDMSLAELSWTGVSFGALWGLLNFGLDYLFRNDGLDGSIPLLILSFSVAGALFSLFILFLAAWFADAERQSPYLTMIRISVLIWLISVVMGGVASRYNPDRYHFDWMDHFWGGSKVLLLGFLLGWRIKRLTLKRFG
ncbi:MAG: hypothetical protein HY200_04645 [Nitrospirae bacterium]|nr:hypothetical protein [Nitrospirota bacterium]MBI3594225.1 hypothetical protein [Nitrospirota bacterium]